MFWGMKWPLGDWLSQHPQRQIVRQIEQIYRECDARTGSFRRAARAGCLSGCGHCCERGQPQTTVAEVLPLAWHLWRTRTAGLWLDLIQKLPADALCVFYSPFLLSERRGGCRIYPLRPLLCRLFGFSARRDKQEVKQLVACSAIKDRDPGQFHRMQDVLAKGGDVPVMSDYANRIIALAPWESEVTMPINLAVREALTRIGFMFELEKRSGAGFSWGRFCQRP